MSNFTPEMGQAVFGNAWSPIDMDYRVQEGISALATVLVQAGITENDPTEGDPFDNGTFAIRPYYWGDCTCGWDDIEYDGEHDPDCYQTELNARLVAEGVDWGSTKPSYEETQKIRDRIFSDLTSKHDLPMQGCAIHCTCTYPQRHQAWFEENKVGPVHGHSEDCPTILPNFSFGSFEGRWYKHLGRSSTQNREISQREWFTIFRHCLESIR